ncbi:MAG: xanthine dehydrogenase accessory protein XdhC [Pseudomonadota bacterium]
MTAVWVEIVETRGSAPRDAGTAMKVSAHQVFGTIGGGELEHRAIALARSELDRDGGDVMHKFPLGPDLGQCCGGAVSLRITRQNRDHLVDEPLRVARHSAVRANRDRRQMWLWGAGHVGRAVALSASPKDFQITWVDTASDRFPTQVPADVTVLPALDMPRLAAHSPPDAQHLIFTRSHEIDFNLCAQLLAIGAHKIGLIGSDTKKTRFFKRLRALNLDPSQIACPIGDKTLGKAPAQIADGVLASLKLETTP